MSPFLRQITFYLVIALVVFALLATFNSGTPPTEISYDQFISKVEQGEVTEVATYGNDVEAVLVDGTEVVTVRPEDHNQIGRASCRERV